MSPVKTTTTPLPAIVPHKVIWIDPNTKENEKTLQHLKNEVNTACDSGFKPEIVYASSAKDGDAAIKSAPKNTKCILILGGRLTPDKEKKHIYSKDYIEIWHN